MKKFIILILIILPSYSFALTAEEHLENPAQEQQARDIFRQIRCVVCSGESINDSKADLAKEMRVMIRNEIDKGRSEEQIINELTQSYGIEILMTPPVIKETSILWFFPIIAILLGVSFIAYFFNKNNK